MLRLIAVALLLIMPIFQTSALKTKLFTFKTLTLPYYSYGTTWEDENKACKEKYGPEFEAPKVEDRTAELAFLFNQTPR